MSVMRVRGVVLVAVAAATVGSLGQPAGAAIPQDGVRICTWGGTPVAPTGRFSFDEGLTNTPSTGPIHAVATGALAGGPGCSGTVTFEGDFAAGSTCNAFTIAGTVAGLPSVARFQGAGGVVSVDVLFDRAGNIVGFDQPQVLTPDNVAHATDCNGDGFKAGTFSSTVELLTAG
jgi:hypothetical protein